MAVQISGNDITVPRDGTFSRNVSIAGTLTYEDVTNVDSIGLVTARNGIEVGASPGVAASISVDGNMIVSGISTFGGDVQVSDKIIHSGDTNTAIRFPAADTFTVETGGSERIRVDSDGNFGIGMSPSGMRLDVQSTANDVARFSGANSGSITIRNDTANEIQIHTGTSDALIFGTNGENERLRIGTSGQLGIAGANYGTSGQVLQSQGSGSAVQWATPTAWVYGTAADYSSGSITNASFSGWPSTWQEIRVSFVNISSSANKLLQFFVSKSSSAGSRITSGYQTTSGYYGSGTGVASVQNQGQFHGTASNAYQMNGYVSFYKFGSTVIRFEGQMAIKTDTYIFHTNGFVTCDPVTDMTHIFFRFEDYAFDYGSMKMDYLAG